MNWRKASRSTANGGDCVEVADRDGAILVRDTKQNDHGPIHTFPASHWRAFIAALKTTR